MDIDDKVVRFAKALFDKVPRTSTSSVGEKRRQENRAKEREAVASQSKRYALIDSDNDDETLKIAPKKVKKSKKEKRKKTSDNDDDDEFDKMENDRKRDLLERDAFAQRLIKKDKDKRKNVAEKSDKRAYEEAAKRLAIEAENRESLVNDLRKESRRTYLSKRKEDKLNELKDDIMDDEFLFDEDQLTEKEKAERRYKKKVLELAVQHSKAGEIEKVQRYHMPEDRKDKKDKHFDKFDEKDKAPNYEQKRWEEEHLHSAQFNFGAKDAKVRHAMKEKQYDLLLDDEIEFIQVSWNMILG